jgi:hypothetical protein
MQSTMKVLVAAAITLFAVLAHAQQNEIAKLLPDDGQQHDHFGDSVCVSGDTAIIGAPDDDDNGSYSGSAYVFTGGGGGGAWTQQAKLLLDEGVEFDLFGTAVSISGDTAVIGAPGDSPNGIAAGSAYIYTRSGNVWTQQGVLLASDGAENDMFGSAVSIDGDTAVIGVHYHNDVGDGFNSAYVFTRSGGVWSQQARLQPDDGEEKDGFGAAVSVNGDTVIVGAWFDDDNGEASGSAYIFTRSGGVWTQQSKLLPADGAAVDRFGFAVSISDDTAFIAAPSDDDNGSDSGSVYVFARSGGVWTQLNKLVPGDGEPFDAFGRSVSVDGSTAIIGANGDDDIDSGSGAAYVFTSSSGLWTQQVKFLPSDGARADSFGEAVSISGATALIGSPDDDDDDNGSNSGSAYVFSLDTDGDGLLDDWEVNGIPYTGAGGFEWRFVLPGADPYVKDLYVEVDAMSGFLLDFLAVGQLEFAFGAAPVPNPDNPDGTPNIDGVTLHILRDETDLPHVAVWDTDGCWPLDFDNWRLNGYGTVDERADPDNVAMLEAKAKAYRYCIVADSADNPATPDKVENVGGCGQTPGDNFVIFLGGGNYDSTDEAAVFMHELGHNLGLDHGGGDDMNGKPNYPSIMNYVMGYKYAWNEDFWELDFSREDAGNFVALNESALEEAVGIGSPGGLYSGYTMPFGVNVDDSGDTVREVQYVTLDGSPTDFGDLAGTMFQDGSSAGIVSQDLNFATDGPDIPDGIPSSPSFPQTLEPYDDWANVGLPLAAALGDGAPAPSFPTDELTVQARDWINENFPPPPGSCRADLNDDGVVDTLDFLAFLGAWSAGDSLADWNGDGVVNTLDFLAYLTDWVAGCP